MATNAISIVTEAVGPIRGFRVGAVDAGIYAHFRKSTRPDLALIVADGPCAAAGLFTTNLVKAAPVIYDQKRLGASGGYVRAVLVNAGCANACTGETGLKIAEETAVLVSESLNCPPNDVLLMSTGVIGTQLPIIRFQTGVPAVVSSLRPDGWDSAARAIMTTDTRPKQASLFGGGYTVAGIAKGAGMIAPNMATMLSVLVTDAQVAPELLHRALVYANDRSFNRVVVDGDMSTNDTVLILASGASGVAVTEANFQGFADRLAAVSETLARKIVMDGEGVTRYIILQVIGARSAAEARQIGNTIATSPLVKTAFYGGDANWGRILAAAGRAGIPLDPYRLSLWYDELQLVDHGMPLPYDEARANAIAGKQKDRGPIMVRLDLGLGNERAEIWTCDLSHDYVSINGHYRT